MTSEETKELKRQKLELIRFYHRDLIKDLGIPAIDFSMKVAFRDQKNNMVIGVFANGFVREKGYFIEIVISGSYDPADPERKVYRIAPNPHFEDEYEYVPKNNTYLVPLDDLRPVNPEAVAISKSSAVTSSDNVFNTRNVVTVEAPVAKVAVAPKVEPKQDAPYSELTIRDFVAIHTGKPVSLKPWLNDLIKSSN